MKSKPSSSLAILILGVTTLFVLGCQLASQVAPASTPVPSNTFAPISTPTEAFTATPAPRTDISSAVLLLEDLPAGFEEFTLEELGISMADFESEEFQPEEVFVFLNTQNFQMIFGFNFLLVEKLDRATFDIGVSQPELTLPAFVGGMGSENVRDEKVLEGIEDIGEVQIGMTMVATMQDIPTQVDVVMFRRDMIGAMVMSMTLEGKSPNIAIQDLGLKLDQHVQETLQSTE